MFKKINNLLNQIQGQNSTDINLYVEQIQKLFKNPERSENLFQQLQNKLKDILMLQKEAKTSERSEISNKINENKFFDEILINFVKFQKSDETAENLIKICEILIEIADFGQNENLMQNVVNLIQNCYILSKSRYFLKFLIKFIPRHQNAVFSQQILDEIVNYSQVNFQALQLIFNYPKYFQQCNVEQNTQVIVKTLIINQIEYFNENDGYQGEQFQNMIEQIQFLVKIIQKFSKNMQLSSETLYKNTINQIFQALDQEIKQNNWNLFLIENLLYFINIIATKVRYVNYQMFSQYINIFDQDNAEFQILSQICQRISNNVQYEFISIANELLNYQIQVLSASYLQSFYEIGQNEYQIQNQRIVDDFKFYSNKTEMPKFNGDFIAQNVESNIAAQWSGCLQRNLEQFEQDNEINEINEEHSEQFDPANVQMNLSVNKDIKIECRLPQFTFDLINWSLKITEKLKENDFTGDDDGTCFQGRELIKLFDFEQLLLETIKQIIMMNPYLSQASLIVNTYWNLQIIANRQNKMYAFIKANNIPLVRSNDEKLWVKFTPELMKKLYLTYDEIQGIVHGYLLSQIKK